MAKFNHGVFTKTRGKLGGVVFQQYEGMQIGKEYQPVVKNPNAPEQIATRSRFSLASKTNAILFPWIGVVLKANGINYERFQRADMLRRLMGVITYDPTEEHAVLGRFPEVRTSSASQLNISVSGQIANGTLTVTPTVTGSTVGTTQIFYKVVFFPSDGSTPTAMQNSSPNNTPVTFTMPSGFSGSVVMLAYLAEESENMAGVSYGDLVGSASGSIATLGIETSDTTRYLISNLAQANIWTA